MAVLRIHAQLKFDIVKPEHKSGRMQKKRTNPKNRERKGGKKKAGWGYKMA